MNWLLLCAPIAVLLEHWAPEQHLWIFVAAGIAILPLAGWLGRATEQLAERLGEGPGGLLNATFGNAAELIIALAALRAGLFDVVKASLAGSILGNILLVLGASMLAGGLRYREQTYNAAGARSQATMLLLAVIALIVPAVYQRAQTPDLPLPIAPLSLAIACVLLAIYALNLVFVLVTHAKLFAGPEHVGETASGWPLSRALLVLGAATGGLAWMSEVLVGAIEPAAEELGLGQVFVGIFIVAILGNAAEHATAITAARANRMDLSLSIAIGSSVQVAVFVAPLLVLLSYVMGPGPMDLSFSGGQLLAIVLAVAICGHVAGDGRSDWLRGAQLLAVYLILAIAFYFIPVAH